MAEAIWRDGAETQEIDWRMSASLENVPRGDSDVAEVTNLEQAVRDWLALDPPHRADAILRTEDVIQIKGAGDRSFSGEAIAALASMLPRALGSE